MSLWTLVHFFAFLTNLYISLFILYKNRRSPINQVCSATVFLFSVWSFGAAFLRSRDISLDEAMFLNNLSSLGWIGFSVFFLWFTMILSGRRYRTEARAGVVIAGAVALFFTGMQWGGAFMKTYRLESYGWVGVWESSLWTMAYFLYYGMCIFLGLLMIFRYRTGTGDLLKRKQAGVLILSVLLSVIPGSFSSILLRGIGIYSIPPLGDVFTIFFAGGLFYATARYRLFELTPATAADKILETMPDMLILLDARGRVVICNASFYALTGYTPEELAGKSYSRFFPRELHDLHHVDWLLKSDSLSNYKGSIVAKSGSPIPVLLSVSVMRDDSGRRSGFVIVAHDYTVLDRAEKGIAAVLSTTKLLLEWLPIGVIIFGGDGRIRMANRQVSVMTGYSRDELTGKERGELILRAEAVEPVRRAGAPGGERIETVLMRRSGDEVPVIVSSLEIELEGELVSLEAFADISELVRVQEDLKTARDLAESANRAKSAFLANMSHEIRTPLNAILGFAGLLLNEERETIKREKLEIINVAGENLLKTLNDILDFSRIEAGRTLFEKSGFSLKELIAHIHQTFSPRAADKKLSFSVRELTPIPPRVVGDRYRIVQVLSNLTDNAVKFTSEGGIEMEYSYSDGMFLCTIADTGIGIPGESREDIFASFSQADASSTRQYGGSGLGLAIVKNLTEGMGGSVRYENRQGKGTVFTVILPLDEESRPLDREETALPAEHASPNTVSQTVPVKGRFRVLVTEDNEMNQRLLGKLLERLEAEYEIAGNGRVALQKLREAAKTPEGLFDLVLLDIQMPVLDGMETIKEIRRDDELKGLYVIALTAHALQGDEDRFLSSGFNDYIAKPLDIRDFFSKIEALKAAGG